MGLIKKIKVWWKTKTTTEKIYIILGGVSTAAAITSTVCAVRTCHSMDDIKIDVNLYPNGKDDPNPIKIQPADDEHDDPYELARKSFNLLSKYCDDGDCEDLENAQDTVLQLAWDLAARENLLEKANSEIPTQLHD